VRRLQRAGALSPGRTSDPRLSHRRGDLALSFTAGSDNEDDDDDEDDPLAGCPALQAVVAALAALGAAVGAALRARGRVRGLRHAQTQVAVFSPAPCGSRSVGFLRHSDVTPDAPDRVLTLVCYLNAARWPARAGGQLRVFAPRGSASAAAAAEVLPAGGTVVALRSAVEHEVAPAARTRMAVTCWHVGEAGGAT
jgi:hypothetical protein